MTRFVTEVMGHRMGGPELNAHYSLAMLDWLHEQKVLRKPPTEEDAVARGSAS